MSDPSSDAAILQAQARLAVAALTQGSRVPSTRFRLLQHLDCLAAEGIAVDHLPARHGAYPPPRLLRRLEWLPATVADAASRVRRANRANVRFLQRELVSTLQTAEPWLRAPLVFDVDDAIFLHPRGRITDRIASRAALTICGNTFLANHYSAISPVVVLPTAVDTDRFLPATTAPTRPTIGWSGSSSGFAYLYAIEDALRVVLERNPDAIFHVIADLEPNLKRLPARQMHFQPWHPDTEVAALQRFTVGLMPLTDDAWSRGKCSFKMLTYMAIGIPVVVSPVGMNTEVLSLGQCGLAASSHDDWIDAIELLLHTPHVASTYGRAGREAVELHFSRRIVAPRLARLLRQAAGES